MRKSEILAIMAFISLIASGYCTGAIAKGATLSGEQKVWRTITLDVEGPQSSETATPNPFADYRLDVIFQNGARKYTVPGYFAACGNAAETSCTEGNVWRVHFTPDKPGRWRYKTRFLQGADVAVTGKGTAVKGAHNLKGRFDITAADAPEADPRNRGRLQYVGKRYLEYAATGAPFFKAGADAPENMLAYDGFDATPNVNGLRKSWAPHLQDAQDIDLTKYGWRDEGAGILGAIAYLADHGANAVSFLTFNVGGDDRNVFPHLMKISMDEYESYNSADNRYQGWELGVHHDRFDVSKMDQWARVLSYGNDRGMYLHFKMQETENDHLMDGGATGRERTLYYRELIARYSHFLALNWNLGEETNQPAQYLIDMAAKVEELDPYGHLRVLHTFPFEKFRYHDLLGDKSAYTGLSVQGSEDHMEDVRSDVIEWTLRAEGAGKHWVVAYDEAGAGGGGTPVDADYPDEKLPGDRNYSGDPKLIRGKVIWNTFTAGGAGVEHYYGYQSGCGDLQCQDHRTRAQVWKEGRIALEFMRKYVGAQANNMTVLDKNELPLGYYIFGKRGERYVIYAHSGKSRTLFTGEDGATFTVSWYDPRKGGDFVKVTHNVETGLKGLGGSLVIEDAPYDIDEDWVLLVTKDEN